MPKGDLLYLGHMLDVSVQVHDYLDVDFDVVWEVVTTDLPELIAQLSPIAPPSPDP